MTQTTNKCLNCDKPISLKATYCSDKCRMAYKRNNPNKKVNKPEQITPNNPNRNNPNNQPEQTDRIGKVIKGYCHGCGQDILTIKGLLEDPKELPTQEMANRICICLHCISKGITHKSLGIDIDNPVCQEPPS